MIENVRITERLRSKSEIQSGFFSCEKSLTLLAHVYDTCIVTIKQFNL